MKNITLLLAIITLNVATLPGQNGFDDLTNTNLLVTGTNTSESPQSKTWTYAGQHWAVLATTATNIYRLDNSTWNIALNLASGITGKADIKVVNNVTHIFFWKGVTSYLYSVEYDAATNTYKSWTPRKTRVSITTDNNTQCGTIDIDATGRMWLAYDGASAMFVKWSDPPYSTWSEPIQIATGTTNADLCSVITLPGKVGVFWSNKNTKRFGFKTHDDGTDPITWSADETPAIQQPVNVGGGFADNQFNLKTNAAGILYSVLKTNYATANYPQVALLVRRPNGNWDPLYEVSPSGNGTKPIILLNETANKIKVVYTSSTGNIQYRESSTNSIAFSQPFYLLNGSFDNASSSKTAYSNQTILVASNSSNITGVLCVDNPTTTDIIPPGIISINRQIPVTETINTNTVTYRIQFNERVNGVDQNDFMFTKITGTVEGAISSVTDVENSGTSYDVTVASLTGDGSFRLDVKSTGTAIADLAGNNLEGGYTGGQQYIIQSAVPTLSFVSIASNNIVPSLAKPGDVITLQFTASGSINSPEASIANHPATIASNGNNNYAASYTMDASDAAGIIPFTIDFTSAGGEQAVTVTGTTNGSNVSFDKSSPLVTSINRQSPLEEIITASGVTFRITFNEPIKNIDVSDFIFKTSNGTVSGTISGVNMVENNSAVYDLSIVSISGNGSFQIDMKEIGTGIIDLAGNPVNTGFTSGQLYTVQQTQNDPALTFVSISSNNSTTSLAKPGDVITVNFTASESITNITVMIATIPATVTNNGSNNYNATYTMTGSDVGGQIPFTIQFSNANGSSQTTVTTTTNGSIVIFDKIIPSAININRQTPASENTSGTSVTFRINFSEPVVNVDATDFNFTRINGTVNGVISSVVMEGTNGVNYDIVVSSLTGTGSFRADLKSTGTGIADLAGNAISTGFSNGQFYTVSQILTQAGFKSVTPLSPINLSLATKDKPQAKVWTYAGRWWCVLSAVGGTKIFRLDGTTWTEILTLNTKSSKPDCRVAGNLVHILFYKGASNNSYLYSIEFDPVTTTYKPWKTRTSGSLIIFPPGSEAGTIVLDGNGRLWAATDGTNTINVWWSDAPYSSWSAPVTIATGVKDDDICALTAMPALGKIGIFWSNQVTKRFGFKTHTDGTDPLSWSADEIPASQSAINNIGYGMADDHMNLKVASDGTVYCAAKTGYNRIAYPKVILLVRRPNGIWDNQYTVTTEPEGTQPIVLLNEDKGLIKVVYATVENGGDIKYSESQLSNIAFSPAISLISSPGMLYDYNTSTHQNYSSEIVIMATNLSSNPIRAESVIASDENTIALKASSKTIYEKDNAGSLKNELTISPNPVSAVASISFRLAKTSQYELSIVDQQGQKLRVIKTGLATAGVVNKVPVNNIYLPAGIYHVQLQTGQIKKSCKMVITR
ncbi:MAG: T9SS type A sorting domain-containing protein [Bacteroidota bacterium]